MPITVLGGTKLADTGYEVANSCRFNDGDSSLISRTIGTPTNDKKWTFSAWVKRCTSGAQQILFEGFGNGANYDIIELGSSDQLKYKSVSSSAESANQTTNMLFRDVSAWYHIVVAQDSTQAAGGNRLKIYVNGAQITSLATDTQMPENHANHMNVANEHNLAASKGAGGGSLAAYFDGYLAEVVFIDGTQYAATDFGEYNEDSPNMWQPKDVSGLTFGDNGFYLDFEASDNLGNDANGGTDWSETNLAAADQATDTPTNNFCTLNSRFHTNWQQQVTNTKGFAQGNCTLLENTHSAAIGTMGTTTMPFYYEVKLSSNDFSIGIMATNPAASVTASIYSYNDATAYGFYPGSTARKITAGVWALDSTFSGSGTYHFAVDPVNNKIWIGKDGTWDGDPAAGTGNIVDLGTHEYTPWGHCSGSGGTNIGEFNFGGCSAFDVSSGNADANGYGNFEFSVPSGYLALCSKNLGENG